MRILGRTARVMHDTTNRTYWAENPNCSAGSDTTNLVSRTLRALPFSMHEAQKHVLFDTTKLIAVNGECVVVKNGPDKVDKFMLKYPREMKIEKFRDRVAYEVGVVTSHLPEIALPTEVSIKDAYIFRRHSTHVPAVTQTQDKLDLGLCPELDLAAIFHESDQSLRDRTARDLETLLEAAALIEVDYGYHPDLALGSGNVRRSVLDGAITLIDVMPYYTDGSRLIGNDTPESLGLIKASLDSFEEFVGQYGS